MFVCLFVNFIFFKQFSGTTSFRILNLVLSLTVMNCIVYHKKKTHIAYQSIHLSNFLSYKIFCQIFLVFKPTNGLFCCSFLGGGSVVVYSFLIVAPIV